MEYQSIGFNWISWFMKKLYTSVTNYSEYPANIVKYVQSFNNENTRTTSTKWSNTLN